MGTWGVKLYQDDVADDVKYEYITRLQVGQSNLEATRGLIEGNYDYISDEEDGPIFWFALADTQWKYGRLLPEVKDKAIEYLKSGCDLMRWKDNDKLYKKRKAELELLEKRLNSPLPAEKKVTKYKFSRPLWEIGDVLIYQIKSDKLKDSEWYNKYIMFRVIALYRTNIGSLPRDIYYNENCVVGLYNWFGDSKPEPDIVKNLELIPSNNKSKHPYAIAVFCFSKKEVQELNITVLMHDKDYQTEMKQIESSVGLIWPNSYNLNWTMAQVIDEFRNKNSTK